MFATVGADRQDVSAQLDVFIEMKETDRYRSVDALRACV